MKDNDKRLLDAGLSFSDIGEAVVDYQKPNFPMIISSQKYTELLLRAKSKETISSRFASLCAPQADNVYFKFDEVTKKYGLWLTYVKNIKKNVSLNASEQQLGLLLILLSKEESIIFGEIKTHHPVSGNDNQITILNFTVGLDDRKTHYQSKFLANDFYLGWSHESLNHVASMLVTSLLDSSIELAPEYSMPQFVFSSIPQPKSEPKPQTTSLNTEVNLTWLDESEDFAKLEAIKQMDINPSERLMQLISQSGLMSTFENGYAFWVTMPEFPVTSSTLESADILVKLTFLNNEAMFTFEAQDIHDISDDHVRHCMATSLIDLNTKRLKLEFIEAQFVNGWNKVLLQHVIDYFHAIALERPSAENRKRRATELNHWSRVLEQVRPEKRMKQEVVQAKKIAIKKVAKSYSAAKFQEMLVSADSKTPLEKLEYLIECADGYLKDKKHVFYLEWDLGGETRKLQVSVYQTGFESTIEEQKSFIVRAGKRAEGDKYFYIKINELIDGVLGKDSILQLRISPDVGSCEIMFVHAGSEKLPKGATRRLTGDHVITGPNSLLGMFGNFLPINYWVLHDAAHIKVPSYSLSVSAGIPEKLVILNNPQTIYLSRSEDNKIDVAAVNGFYKLVSLKLDHKASILTKGYLTQNEIETIFNKLEKLDFTLTQYEEIPLNLKNLLENRKSYYGEKLGMEVIDSACSICLLNAEAQEGDKNAVRLKHEVLIIRKAPGNYSIGYLDKMSKDYAELAIDQKSRADSSLIAYLDTLEFDGRIYTYEGYEPKNKVHVDLYQSISQRIINVGGDIYEPIEKCSTLLSSSPGAIQIQSRAQYYQACRTLFEMNLSSIFLAEDEDHKRLLIYIFISTYQNIIQSLDETNLEHIAETYATSNELLKKIQELMNGLECLDSPDYMRHISRYFANETLGSFWMTQKQHRQLIQAWRFIKLTPTQLSQPLLYHYRSTHLPTENVVDIFKQHALTVSSTRAFECRGPLKN